MQNQLITNAERYFLSSLITFITAFLISLGAQLQSAGLSPATFGWATVAAILIAALRAGVKALVEYAYGAVGDKFPNPPVA